MVIQPQEVVGWDVTIIVEVFDKRERKDKHTPFVRVLTVPEKVTDTTEQMVKDAWTQVQREGYPVQLVDFYDCDLNGTQSSVFEYIIKEELVPLRVIQYMLKKPDNTSYSIVTHSNVNAPSELEAVKSIANSFRLK